MKLDQYGKKVVGDFLTSVKSSGTVSKQDVLSLEGQVEGIVSSTMNVNGFTAMASSTGVQDLIPALECIMAEQEPEETITIDILLSRVEVLKRTTKQRISHINNGNEIDVEMTDNVLNNHFLSRYYGEDENKTLEDITDKTIENITDDIEYIIDSLTKDRNAEVRSSALEVVHEINKALYGKPENAFAILRMTLNNKLTIHMEESDISEVTVRDFIKEFVINNRMNTILKDLHSEITTLQTSLLFDNRYDNNVDNTDSVFTYDYLDKKVKNLEYLLTDNISFYMINIFQKLFSK